VIGNNGKSINKIRIGYNKFRSQKDSSCQCNSLYHHKVLNILVSKNMFISIIKISMLLPVSRLEKNLEATQHDKVINNNHEIGLELPRGDIVDL
jgi:hypothetical protein